MADNFTTIRSDIKTIEKSINAVELRMSILEVEIKHMRDDFKWIKVAMIVGTAIGIVLGLLFAEIGGVFK